MFKVFDPVGDARAAARTQLAARTGDLQGKVVGFLVNEKGADLVTDFETYSHVLEEKLKAGYGVADCTREIKPLLSKVAPREMIDRLASRADVVVTGIGK
ncbi:MAG: hypothetical protein HYX92_18130 [Chloroflexi bacterium]|nr:hypothetical protein [Chloroflexota bacterium]